MAKNDNLKDFLTDVADAIRQKKGTSALINPQDFSAEIASIQSGGGVVEVEEKDVNFYDYDGTRVYSYTKEEYTALSADPTPPSHDDLVSQGWNRSHAQSVLYGAGGDTMHIGALYTTSNGATRLHINIDSDYRRTIPLYWGQTTAKGVTISWGDGTEETFDGTGNLNTTHTYDSKGKYVISIKATSGTLTLGDGTEENGVLGKLAVNGRLYPNMLERVDIGGLTSVSSYAFYGMKSLKTVTMPNKVTAIGSSAFYNCSALKAIALLNSNGMIDLGAEAFRGCSDLKLLSLPASVKKIGANFAQDCYSLEFVSLPSMMSTSALPTYCFQACTNLRKISIRGISAISSRSLYTCTSLEYIKFGGAVSSIASLSMAYCYGLAVLDFSDVSSVPSLAATEAFSSLPSDCKIVVPDSLYSSWKSATNWSTYANRMVKASAFTSPS